MDSSIAIFEAVAEAMLVGLSSFVGYRQSYVMARNALDRRLTDSGRKEPVSSLPYSPRHPEVEVRRLEHAQSYDAAISTMANEFAETFTLMVMECAI